MASLNKVILIGNLGKDPETRHMPMGSVVCNFSIATTDAWKDKEGQKHERTEWHNITMYGKLAEIAAQFLKKGSSVYVEGRLQTRKWQDKNGSDRYTTEIIVDQMQMLGGKDRGTGGSDEAQALIQQHQPGPTMERSRPTQSGGQFSGYGNGDVVDIDIPFVSGLAGDDPLFSKLCQHKEPSI